MCAMHVLYEYETIICAEVPANKPVYSTGSSLTSLSSEAVLNLKIKRMRAVRATSAQVPRKTENMYTLPLLQNIFWHCMATMCHMRHGKADLHLNAE